MGHSLLRTASGGPRHLTTAGGGLPTCVTSTRYRRAGLQTHPSLHHRPSSLPASQWSERPILSPCSRTHQPKTPQGLVAVSILSHSQIFDFPFLLERSHHYSDMLWNPPSENQNLWEPHTHLQLQPHLHHNSPHPRCPKRLVYRCFLHVITSTHSTVSSTPAPRTTHATGAASAETTGDLEVTKSHPHSSVSPSP